jgi:hypothetical protein
MGSRAYVRLPDDCSYAVYNGSRYWYSGGVYYQPYYYGGTVYYSEVPPPVVTEVVPLPSGCDTALAELKRMSAFLGTVKAGQVTIRDESDEILSTGQKVKVESKRILAVRVPDRMAVDYSADGVTRRTVYDGRTITVIDNEKNLYAQQAMPATLEQTAEVMATKYGMALPAAELLRPGLMTKLEPQIRSAQILGPQSVDGTSCQMVTFSMDWADVQIWIQTGEQALPRRVIISYKKIPSTPKYVMNFSDWKLAAPPESVFDLKLPANATRIEMTPIGQSGQGGL